MVPNCPVPNCPPLLSWCQIVRFYYLGAKLSALSSWCQIVRCRIVRCQIVLQSLEPHSQTSIINSTKMMIMTTGWVFMWGSWISVLNQGAIAENPAGPTPTWTSRINTLSASSLATSSELSKTTSSKCFLSQFA